ncbi:MAG: redoxin domain-containing protein [Planctomycetota bacterium]
MNVHFLRSTLHPNCLWAGQHVALWASRAAILALIFAIVFPATLFAQDDKKPESGDATPSAKAKQGDSQEVEDEQEDEKPAITVGSDAPEIDVEYWISDDNGYFLHTKEFEKGNIYVIDFWSVRWVPATRMLPRLVEIQDKFRDDDVQIISIGLHEPDVVETFLDQKVPEQKSGEKKTFRDVTETLSFTADPDRSVFNDYFEASGRSQVPCSFVVGKDGKIEWIGHPKDLEEPLSQLVNDEWDRESFAKTYEKELAKQVALEKENQAVQKALLGFPRALNDGREGALKYLTEAIKDPENELAKRQLTMIQVQLMVGMKHEDAAESLRKFADDYTNDETTAGELNDMIWQVYERHEAFGDIPEEVLDACLYAARIAVKFSPKSGAINDTVAHFVYVVEEDLDEAIEWQKKAVANANGREADLQPFLDQLLEEKKNGKKKKEDKKSDKKKDKSDF